MSASPLCCQAEMILPNVCKGKTIPLQIICYELCALPEFRKSLFEFLICYQDTKYFIVHDYITLLLNIPLVKPNKFLICISKFQFAFSLNYYFMRSQLEAFVCFRLYGKNNLMNISFLGSLQDCQITCLVIWIYVGHKTQQ